MRPQFDALIGVDSLAGVLALVARALPDGALSEKLLDALLDLLVDGAFSVASRTGPSGDAALLLRV